MEGIEGEVFVVDKLPSRRRKADMVKTKNSPAFALIESAENVGIRQGKQYCCARRGGSLSLLINPDTVVQEALSGHAAVLQGCPPCRISRGAGSSIRTGLPASLPRTFPTPGWRLQRFRLRARFPKSKLFGRYKSDL